jgi:hypothetical protein
VTGQLPRFADASETELAKVMLLQQMDTMFGAMKEIEGLIGQNLSVLNDRIQELSARVNQFRKKIHWNQPYESQSITFRALGFLSRLSLAFDQCIYHCDNVLPEDDKFAQLSHSKRQRIGDLHSQDRSGTTERELFEGNRWQW